MRSKFLFILALAGSSLQAQLSNTSFRITPAMPETRWGTTFEALQFLKNNEYFNDINPGETLFGFQMKGLLHYRINSEATFSTGILLQKDFGDPKFLTKAIPIFNIHIQKTRWQYNLGNIQPNVFHNMPEPMLNYEYALSHPVEMGIQAKRKTKKMFYDAWLEWKQKLDQETSRQELIVFGQSLEENLFKVGKVIVSTPNQFIAYHQGGQALKNGGHIATRFNLSNGLRLKTRDSGFVLESFFMSSLDNSPALQQPYTRGWASMTNIRVRMFKYHEVALTWWYASDYQTVLGAPMFSNVNYSNVYANSSLRKLAMLRYVFSRPIIGNNLWIDFRFEPYYDFGLKKLEFSNGLYFRYISTLEIHKPRWM